MAEETIEGVIAGWPAAPAGMLDQAGPPPMLQWIAIERLVVDRSYQRQIGHKGRQTIRKIVAGFDWSKFSPVIVAPVTGGRFAIIDGQHRTTAARLCGADEVPCQVVQADRAEQAAAFAAVNGEVTAVSRQVIYHARLAAGDPEALRVKRVCDAAEVTILKYPKDFHNIQHGETMAVGAIERCIRQHGEAVVITALQCVSMTGDGANEGELRGATINAICDVLDDAPEWLQAGARLLEICDLIEWSDMRAEALARQVSGSGTMRANMAALFRQALESAGKVAA